MDDHTVASYDAAGFGRSTNFGQRPALLVIDMCQAYFTSSSPLDLGQPEVAESVSRIVEAARSAQIVVAWTRVEFEPGTDNIWYRKIDALSSFDRGNVLADWLPRLAPESAEIVVTKQHASGFFGTDLASQLTINAVDSVMIVGVSTSGCIRATATDASASGFVPFVVREAVGDRTEAVHEANLFDLHAKYADVITSDDAHRYLNSLNDSLND